MKALDIIIPCYNPNEQWADSLKKSIETINKIRPDIGMNFIIVDDGSKNKISIDESYLDKWSIKIVRLKRNMGKGAAIRKGFKVSDSHIKIFTDNDFPYRYTDLFSLYQAIKDGANVAVGVRLAGYSSDTSYIRRFLSNLSKVINKHVFNLPFQDSQAGIKGFDNEGAKLVSETKINGYLFDLEVLKKAVSKKEIAITSVPVELREDITLSNFRFKVLIKELINLFKIILN